MNYTVEGLTQMYECYTPYSSQFLEKMSVVINCKHSHNHLFLLSY